MEEGKEKEAGEEAGVVVFSRKRPRNAAAIRKKPDLNSAEEGDAQEEDERVNVSHTKHTNLRLKNNPLLLSSKTQNKDAAASTNAAAFSYESDRTACVSGGDATRSLELETEEEIQLKRRKKESGGEGEGEGESVVGVDGEVVKVYKGMANYPKLHASKEVPKSVRTGPVRSTTYNVRSSASLSLSLSLSIYLSLFDSFVSLLNSQCPNISFTLINLKYIYFHPTLSLFYKQEHGTL